MAISGAYDYSVTASDIITASLTDIQVLQNGETADNNDITTALRSLNLITKELMGKPNVAPGLKRWTRKTLYQFLRLNKNIYTLCAIASSGDYCATGSYNQGTTTASAASGQAVIAVTAMVSAPVYQATVTPATGDYVGVQLSTGDFQWSTVSGSPTLPGNITFAANLTATVNSGAQVYSFPVASQVNVPLDVLTLVRRDLNAIDYPTDKMADIYEYEQLTNKNITSTPIQWFYQKNLASGSLYINCVPSTVTDVLRMICLYPIDDESVVGNTMAFPQQFYSLLRWLLAKDLAPAFGKVWTDTMQQNLESALISAAATDVETVYQYFQPGREGGNFNYTT